MLSTNHIGGLKYDCQTRRIQTKKINNLWLFFNQFYWEEIFPESHFSGYNITYNLILIAIIITMAA